MSTIGSQNVEAALRTMSHDSGASETSITSSVANERLHQNLETLPKNTIEPPKSPGEQKEDRLRFFACPKCDSVTFQRFEDLLLHQKESHNFLLEKSKVKSYGGPKLKRYICSKCKNEFKNAFMLAQHTKNEECKEIVILSDPVQYTKRSRESLFKKDEFGMWVCPEKVNGIICDYKVKTKFLMSQHIRYSHFQRKACFVSRDENLRNAAISFEAEKARQDKIQKQQNEERLEKNRKQRKLREKRKLEKEAAAAAAIKSSPVKPEIIPKREARPKKTPERFANAIPESILDSLENGGNLGYSFFHESPKKIQKIEPKSTLQAIPPTHRLPVIQSKNQLTNQGPSSLPHPPQQSVIRKLISSNPKPPQLETIHDGESVMDANQITVNSNTEKPTHEDFKMESDGDGILPWGSVPMDPVPPNYEIEYVEEPIQKEEFVPQLNVPLQQPPINSDNLDLKNSILLPKINIPPPKRIIHNWGKKTS